MISRSRDRRHSNSKFEIAFSNMSRGSIVNGQDVIKVIRLLEKLQTKYGEVVADKKYIETCKKEHLIRYQMYGIIPTFAKVIISIKNGTHKLIRKILLFVMNIKLDNKNPEKRKLKKQIKKMCIEMRRNLNLIVLSTSFHQMRVVVKLRLKNFNKRH